MKRFKNLGDASTPELIGWYVKFQGRNTFLSFSQKKVFTLTRFVFRGEKPPKNSTHRIHVGCIYSPLVDVYGKCIGEHIYLPGGFKYCSSSSLFTKGRGVPAISANSQGFLQPTFRWSGYFAMLRLGHRGVVQTAPPSMSNYHIYRNLL